jgi:MFS family permease
MPAADLSRSYSRRWWVLATMTVCLLVVIMGNTILNVALPTVQRDLGATHGELQWAVDAYILVFAGLLFTWGVIGDASAGGRSCSSASPSSPSARSSQRSAAARSS